MFRRIGRRRNATRVLGPWLLAGVLVLATSRTADATPCVPWPGEPTPLPTVASTDPILSRYASLRASQLLEAALRIEGTAPGSALRLLQHAACFDSTNAVLRRDADQNRPVQVFRPAVVGVRAGVAADPDAADHLDAVIRVVRVVPVERTPVAPRAPAPVRPAPAPDWTQTDRALGNAEAQLRDADFDAALAAANRIRAQIPTSGDPSGARKRRARADVVAATAEVALGREEAARKSFERALEADPSLNLDPATTSPKVRRSFDAARAKEAKP